MWSVLRKDILVPDQPRLDWRIPNAGNNLDLGTRYGTYLLDTVPEIAAINRPYDLPQTSSPWYLPSGLIEGTQQNVGAVCIAWRSNGYAGQEGHPPQFVHIRIGSRYGVRLSAHRRTAFEPNGLPDWQGHLGLSYSYGLFELYDGSVGTRRTINHSARMAQNQSHAIVAGFVKVDGQMRLIGWMSEMQAEDLTPWNAFNCFGAGAAFLEMPVDEEYVCDAPISITWPTEDHGITLHLAAEKIGPWDSHELGVPEDSQQLLANAGTTMASLRPRHANFLAPAFQSWFTNNPPSPSVIDYQQYGSVPPIDLHGFAELTRQRWAQSDDWRLVWFGACMGYAHNSVASWLEPGEVSNLHHDATVNQRLSQITFTAVSLKHTQFDLYPIEIVDSVATCSPAVPLAGNTQGFGAVKPSLNEYAGVGSTNVGWSMSVLVSIYRRDSITPYYATSYSEIVLSAEFSVRLSVRLYDAQNQSRGTVSSLIILSQQQAAQLLAGEACTMQTTGPNTFSGTISLQATG